MKQYFVIETVPTQAFWDSNQKRFRGWIFATKYNNYIEAENECRFCIKEPCKITAIFE